MNSFAKTLDFLENPPRVFPLILGALVLATCMFYFALGIVYATKLTPSAKPTLEMKGEAFLQTYVTWGTANEADDALNNRTAIEVLKTGVPRTISGALFLHCPAYSYFVAACYWVGGIRLLSVAAPHAVLGGLICLLLGLTARNAAPQHKELASVFVAFLVLIDARLAMYVGYIFPTMLLMFWFSLALFEVTRLETVRGILLFVLGMVFGTYTQAAFFVVSVPSSLWLLVYSFKMKNRAMLSGALCILGFALLKVGLGLADRPTARSDFQHQADRATAWIFNNPYYDYMSWKSMWEWKRSQPPTEEQTIRYNEYLDRAGNRPMRATWLWISENPTRYATLCFVRLKSELGPFTGQMSLRNRAISTVIWLLIFPAGFYGLGAHRHHHLTHLAIVVVLATTAFGTFVTEEPYLRYRMPMDLVLLLYAGLGYAFLVGKFRSL
jgi:hypothetical protein